MKISTEFLTDYFLDKDMGWQDFELVSPMAAHKKDIIVANWRFDNEMDEEDVKKIFKAFKGLYRNNEPIELSYDDFIKEYLRKNDHQF
ncbi:MAG: hypothetical protein ACXVPU_16425 [Bacteroidia bacterium]